jgi:hypothetical protein
VLSVAHRSLTLIALVVKIFVLVSGTGIILVTDIALVVSVNIPVSRARNFNVNAAPCASAVLIEIGMLGARSKLCSAVVAKKILVNIKVSVALGNLVNAYYGIRKPRIA